MMRSNIPTMLQAQDFQSRHSDMIASARCEPLTKREIEKKRFMAGLGKMMENELLDLLLQSPSAGTVRTFSVRRTLPDSAWRILNYGY